MAIFTHWTFKVAVTITPLTTRGGAKNSIKTICMLHCHSTSLVKLCLIVKYLVYLNYNSV